jgi:hypothetical protein
MKTMLIELNKILFIKTLKIAENSFENEFAHEFLNKVLSWISQLMVSLIVPLENILPSSS